MELKNCKKDCVKLSGNFETSVNNCTKVQQNQVQSYNFTHILENSTEQVELYKNKNNNIKINKNIEPINEIELNKFNIIETPNAKDKSLNLLIIGIRSSGKTNLVKEFILRFKKENIIDNLLIFTYQSNIESYIQILEKNQISKIKTKFEINDIDKILEFQSKPDAKPMLLVLDDIIYSNINKYGYNHDNKLFKLLINSRHYKIFIIITMQYPIVLSPQYRTNFDLIFVFNDDFIGNRKRLYEYYFGIITQFKMFNKLMSEYCKNYGILVYKNYDTSNLLKNKVFWYKSNFIDIEEIKNLELIELNNINNVNIELNNSNDKTINEDYNLILNKIKKNNELIKKITKENEKLYELL